MGTGYIGCAKENIIWLQEAFALSRKSRCIQKKKISITLREFPYSVHLASHTRLHYYISIYPYTPSHRYILCPDIYKNYISWRTKVTYKVESSMHFLFVIGVSSIYLIKNFNDDITELQDCINLGLNVLAQSSKESWWRW